MADEDIAFLLGLVHSGPNSVCELGTDIMAFGPARCSPLNGVICVGLNTQATASAGLLNQNPTWRVLIGVRPAAGSKPKIWSSRMVLIVTSASPLSFDSRSLWYQAGPKLWKAGSS